MSIELLEERNENSLFMFIPTQKEKKMVKNHLAILINKVHLI